jgi:L-ascorbate metabolism protein UlaG (beta-lactamase superfamily)
VTEACSVTYAGHATALVEMDGIRLLTDPVLRRRVGPLRRHGPLPGRSVYEDVDALLISHLHHDHADVPSLRRLSRDVPAFAPPGAGNFLRRHGFAAVHELAPGDAAELGGVRIAATEANHPAGRRRFERVSEAIGFELTGRRRVYFAGDTDLFESMAGIGGGRLDLALLPVWGWGTSIGAGHLDPERAARAAALLSPRLAVPIHWGTLFPLGLARFAGDRLTAPPREFARQAAELAPQVEVRVLAPGETTSLS